MLTYAQFIPLRSFEDVSDALNFENHGVQMDGGCDLFSMKAVSDDKKLITRVHTTLNEKHQSDLRIAASLPSAFAASFAASANLSRASPFGNLSLPQNRRKFANLIAVLNATHQDHDFSNVLRPDDFVRFKSLDQAVREIDSKIYNAHSTSLPSGTQTPGGSIMWNPKMWDKIDEEMDLKNCEVYCYKPQDNPFKDEEETTYANMHCFFVSVVSRHKKKQKQKKKTKKSQEKDRRNRVCYLYMRALKPSLKQPVYDDCYSGESTPIKRLHSFRDSVDLSHEMSKRAKPSVGQFDSDYAFEDSLQYYDEDSGYEHENKGRSLVCPIYVN
jgi:hypothetical protein